MSVVSGQRFGGLDSLRGIAALIVVFNHFVLIGFAQFNESFWYRKTFLHWVADGRIAVVLFFVLSGFVLALPFFNGRQLAYKDFIVRRFCRIYLPFLFSVCVFSILWVLLARHGGTMDFPMNHWKADFGIFEFLSHVLATGVTGSDILNPPVWTLIVELRVALLFPLLVFLVRRFDVVAVVASAVIGFFASKYFAVHNMGDGMYFAYTAKGSILLTIYYIQFFMFGVFMAKRIDWIKSKFGQVPPILLGGIGGILFFLPVSSFHLPFSVVEESYALISVYLIGCCLVSDRFNRVLLWAPLQWLGKVSFSLYLMHMAVIYSLIYIFNGSVSMPVILAMSFPIILGVAHLTHKYVEMPSMLLGKRLAPGLMKEKYVTT